MVISITYPGAKNIGIRKKIMLGTWTAPSEGVAVVKIAAKVDKTLSLISSLPK